MPIYLDLGFHMLAYVFGSMLSTCFMLFFMCLCTLCHVCVPRPRLCLSCHIVALLLLCLSFLFFGLLVQTRYRPCGLCYRPYTKAHIKGFGSSYLHVYACLLLCFMLVLASLVLSFATPLAGLCLCSYSRRP